MMTEHVREMRFTLYADTNKRTIKESFHSLRALVQFVARLEDEALVREGASAMLTEDANA